MVDVFESACGNVTTLPGEEAANEVFVSESAKARIAEVSKNEDAGSFLRVAVVGGGCSGFQYYFGFDDTVEEEDFVVEWEGGKMAVDQTSMQYLKGATIDYVKSLIGEHFQVKNSLAKSQCGCGSSFAV